jgi:hypothetical protein
MASTYGRWTLPICAAGVAVLQDPFLFTERSAKHLPAHAPTVREGCRGAELGDFVRGLPNGFKEEVRERGSTLRRAEAADFFARWQYEDP